MEYNRNQKQLMTMEGVWRQAILYRDQIRENIKRLTLENEADKSQKSREMFLVNEQIKDTICELDARKQTLIVNQVTLRNLQKTRHTHPLLQSQASNTNHIQKLINQSHLATKIIKQNNKRTSLKIQDYQNKLNEIQPVAIRLEQQQNEMKEKLSQKIQKNKEIQKVSLEFKEKHIDTRMKINDIIDLKSHPKRQKDSSYSRLYLQKQLENIRKELEQKLDRQSDISFLIKQGQMQMQYQEAQLEKERQKLYKEKNHHQHNRVTVDNLQKYIELLNEQNEILREFTDKCKKSKQQTSILYDKEKEYSNVVNSGKIIKNQKYLFSKQKEPLWQLPYFTNHNQQTVHKDHKNSKNWHREPSNFRLSHEINC